MKNAVREIKSHGSVWSYTSHQLFLGLSFLISKLGKLNSAR